MSLAVCPVVEDARRYLKPAIPFIGSFGIPIRDEVVPDRHRPDGGDPGLPG